MPKFFARASLALAVSALLSLGQANALDYPNRQPHIIVGYPPGGATDILARIFGDWLSRRLGQQFIVENKPGAGNNIATEFITKAAPDGYTILHDATAFSVNPTLLPSLPYDTKKDFVPVFLAGIVPNLLVVHPAVEQKTVAEIIAHAKATGGLEWASSGNGTVQHLSLELFRAQAGIKLNHVPYKGGGPALNDLMGGHIKYFFSNAAASTAHVKSGKIRAVAHTGTGRLASLPDVPPVADTLPGFAAYEWNGVFVPAGTPQEVVDKLSAALNNAIKPPPVAERMAQLSIQSKPNTPAEFALFVASEIEKWGKVVREGNIKSE
jgi:tripartite-type tricarboxylate transporter receptor subunit TctC